MPRIGRPAGTKIEVQCAVCGAEMERYPSQVQNNTTGRFFCSKECRDVLGSKPRRKPNAICLSCGVEYYPSSGNKGMYCSKQCHDKGQRQGRVPGVCLVCQKPFESKASQVSQYCSNRCKGQALWQRPLERKHNGRPALTTPDGYVKVWEPDRPVRRRWVLEHRLVVEQALGRPLLAKEHVHHMNGDKADNRVENLEVVDPTTHQHITVAATQERIQRDRAELDEYRRRYGPLAKEDT